MAQVGLPSAMPVASGPLGQATDVSDAFKPAVKGSSRNSSKRRFGL